MPHPLDYATKRLAQIETQAQSNRGPKTEEGKQRSSQNAIRHGLSGRVVVLPTEDMSLYLKFAKDFIESLKPANPMEHELAQNIADGYWRLKRVRTTEETLYGLGYNEGQSDFDADHEDLHAAFTMGKTFRDHSKAFVNLSIYESRIQRNIEKNTKLLRELQAERKAAEAIEAKAPAKPMQRKEPVLHEFVYSTPEIEQRATVSPSPQSPHSPPQAA